MFVSSLVRWFVSSVEMSKFWLKFLYWCISHKLNIRNHSYLDYRYPIRVHARGWGESSKSRSSLTYVKVLVKVSLLVYYDSISHEPMIRNHSYLDYRYPVGLALFLWVRTPRSMQGGGARVQNLGHL